MTDPRKERTQALALDVARQLFIQRGIDAVTHLEVAQAGGGARRTLYRHWPDRRALLHDVLADSKTPHAPTCGDCRLDLVAHLKALHRALNGSPLAMIVSTLCERSATDPEISELRAELADQGCEPGRSILRAGVRDGVLAKTLDIDRAMAQLEGPLFYAAIVHGRPFPLSGIEHLVECMFTNPPLREKRAASRTQRSSAIH
jgi:AcrR family transcriptional regulator